MRWGRPLSLLLICQTALASVTGALVSTTFGVPSAHAQDPRFSAPQSGAPANSLPGTQQAEQRGDHETAPTTPRRDRGNSGFAASFEAAAGFVPCPLPRRQPQVAPFSFTGAREIAADENWSPIGRRAPRTLAYQAAQILLTSSSDDPSQPNPVRRAVVRLVTPNQSPATPSTTSTPAPTANSSTDAATQSPSTQTPASQLSAPQASSTQGSTSPRPRVAFNTPADTQTAPTATPSAAAPSADPTANDSIGAAATPEAQAETEATKNDFEVRVLGIDPRLRTEFPSFRLALACRSIDSTQNSFLVLKLGEGAKVQAIRPSGAWAFNESTREWRLPLSDWSAGEERDWIIELPVGLEECGVEAEVVCENSETQEPSVDDAQTEATEDSAASDDSAGDEVATEETPSEDAAAEGRGDWARTRPESTANSQSSPDARDSSASLRPAPAPIASANGPRNARSLDDEPQVLAPRTHGVELQCEGPSQTRIGSSVIYELKVVNRSTQSLDQLELSADLPAGVFLEGRRRVLVGESVAPGQSVTLDVAIRAHAVGKHKLQFVLLNDGLTVANVARELEVVDGILQVELGGPESVMQGDEEVFGVQVRHIGEEKLENVVVTLQLGEGQRVTVLEHAAGFDANRRLLAWRIVELQPGDEVVLRYKVVGEQAGEFVQAVAVTAEAVDGPIERRLTGEVREKTRAATSAPAQPRGVRRSLSAPPTVDPPTAAPRTATAPRTSAAPRTSTAPRTSAAPRNTPPQPPQAAPRSSNVPQPPAAAPRATGNAAPSRTPGPGGRVPLSDPPGIR